MKIFTKILKFSTDTKLSYFNNCCTDTVLPSLWKLIRHCFLQFLLWNWHSILLNSSLQFLSCCWTCYRNCWHILNCDNFLKLKNFYKPPSLQGQEGLLQFVQCWHAITLILMEEWSLQTHYVCELQNTNPNIMNTCLKKPNFISLNTRRQNFCYWRYECPCLMHVSSSFLTQKKNPFASKCYIFLWKVTLHVCHVRWG